MNTPQQKNRTKRPFFKIILVIVAISVGTIVILVNMNVDRVNDEPKEEAKVDNRPVALKSDMLFVGDVYWGRKIHQEAKVTELGYAYPFSRLNEFNRDSYNAWIGGLECPVVAGLYLTPAQENATLTFNCIPEYLPEAAKWFTVFSLANNHTDNQGVSGFRETKEQLEQHNIQHFGHYDPRALDEICEVIALPVTVTYESGDKDGQLPVAMCGHHGVFRIPPDNSLRVIEQYSKYMPVFAMPHMGAEYKAEPDEIRRATYRKMIDYGADAVIGGHPHWVQSTEAYKGRPIIYSMGNFIFDQYFNAEVTRSAAIKVNIKTDGVDRDELEKWLAFGDKCKAYQDDCLKQIEEQGLTRLDMTFEFSVVGTSSIERIATLANADQTRSILERMRWRTTIEQLTHPYRGL